MAGAAEQPAYDPTPRRLAEARRRGDVAQSRDLRAALALAATGATLIALGPSLAGLLRMYVATAIAQAARDQDMREAAVLALDSGLRIVVRILAVPLAVAFATSILVGLVQTGGLWVGPLRVDLGRLAVARRAQREVLAGLARSALTVAVLLSVAALTLAPVLPRLASVGGTPPFVVFGAVAKRLGVRLILAALLAGVADELWVRLSHRRRLRMTRSEIDRERKELEGDPIHRQARRREQQRLQAGADPGAAGDVRRADLVVTAGEALAIALRYDPEASRAPIVVAAGRGTAAARVIDEARAGGVPMAADAALTDALAELAPGAEIPEATYEAVAALLDRIGRWPRGRAA
jgi:flagellar biosynthesis protein FlhB